MNREGRIAPSGSQWWLETALALIFVAIFAGACVLAIVAVDPICDDYGNDCPSDR